MNGTQTEEICKPDTNTTGGVKARYLKLTLESNYYYQYGYIDISAIEARDAAGFFIDRSMWSIHESSSHNPPELPENILNSDINSAWRTLCTDISKSYVSIDMGSEHEISSLCYIPKPPVSKDVRGRLKNYTLDVYSGAGTLCTSHHGQFNPGFTTQDIIIDPDIPRHQFCIISRPHHAAENALKNIGGYWADFEPTGRYCREGDPLTVDVFSEIPEGALVEIIVSAP